MGNLLTYIGTLRPNEPTVLFIPGAMTTPYVFDGLANYLPCQSAILDWNHSDGPWEVNAIAKKLLVLIREKKLGNTVVCGYSMGGVISLSAAIQDAEGLIKGLFLADTGASANGHGDPDFHKRLNASWPSEELFQAFLRRCFASPISRGMYLRLTEYAMGLPRETVYQAAKSVRSTDLSDSLGAISCPVLLIHGKRDVSRSERHAIELTQNIPDIEYIRFDCGHTPMVEEHEQYLDKLLYFLEKLNIASPETMDALGVSLPTAT